MDEIENSPNNSESNHVMDNTMPNYLDKRPQLDSKIQQEIRAYYLHNNSFMSQFFRLVVPLLILMIGFRMWGYHKSGGETNVNLLLVISMVALGGFYTILYTFKLVLEGIHVIKEYFFDYDYDEEELGHIHNAPPKPENIDTEISYLLSLPGAPSFEDYKDSRQYEGKLIDYVKLIGSHSLIERTFLIVGLNASLLLAIPDLFMNIFFGEMISVPFLIGLGVIFTCASFMYFQTYQRFSNFFYENAPVASYTLIEYSIFRNLWDNKSKNII